MAGFPKKWLGLTDARIAREINNLDPKCRGVIILKYVMELSYKEISYIVNIPAGTVKSRLNRGRLRLFNVGLSASHLQRLKSFETNMM